MLLKDDGAGENETEELQTIEIELFEPTSGKQRLAVELEKFIDEINDAAITVPQIKANKVSRNSGVVLVNLSSGLRAEPDKKAGLLQMDVAELPNDVKNQKWEFAYRYASLPFNLALNVKKVQPLVNVDQLVEVAIRPAKINVELSAVYDIQLAGIFQIDLNIPQDYQIREIRPLTRNGLTNIPVDTFYRDPNNKDHVIVTLGKKAMGKIGLLVSLDRELNDANLLSPTEVASELKLTVPKTMVEGIEFSKGNLIVSAPPVCKSTRRIQRDCATKVLAKRFHELILRPIHPVFVRFWLTAFRIPKHQLS